MPNATLYHTTKRFIKRQPSQSSADNICEQFDPDQDRSKLFDTLMVFLKDFFFQKVDFVKKNKQMTKRHEKIPCWQIVKMTANLQTADQGPELQCLLKIKDDLS